MLIKMASFTIFGHMGSLLHLVCVLNTLRVRFNNSLARLCDYLELVVVTILTQVHLLLRECDYEYNLTNDDNKV